MLGAKPQTTGSLTGLHPPKTLILGDGFLDRCVMYYAFICTLELKY